MVVFFRCSVKLLIPAELSNLIFSLLPLPLRLPSYSKVQALRSLCFFVDRPYRRWKASAAPTFSQIPTRIVLVRLGESLLFLLFACETRFPTIGFLPVI